MAKRDYQALAAKTVDRRIVLYEREVTRALQVALKDIRADIAEIFHRFSDADGALSVADARAAKRLAAIERNIVSELNTVLTDTVASLRTIHPEMYEQGFLTNAWAVDSEGAVRIDWSRPSVATIRESLTNPEYTASLRRFPVVARGRLRDVLTSGIARGVSYRDMISSVSEVLGITRGDAIRIIRTEGQRAANAGTAAVYAQALDAGVEGEVVWVATRDGRTRDQHAAMDGVYRGDDGQFVLPNGERAVQPLDPALSAENAINCRCTTRFEIAGYAPQLMRTDEGVVPYQPYSEWAADHGRPVSVRVG